MILIPPDMARLMGSDCTSDALKWQFRRFRAGGKLLQAALDNDQDPKDIDVEVNHQGQLAGGKNKSGSSPLFFVSWHNTA